MPTAAKRVRVDIWRLALMMTSEAVSGSPVRRDSTNLDEHVHDEREGTRGTQTGGKVHEFGDSMQNARAGAADAAGGGPASISALALIQRVGTSSDGTVLPQTKRVFPRYQMVQPHCVGEKGRRIFWTRVGTLCGAGIQS